VERSFQEGHIAQKGKELGGARLGVGPIRTAGQEDERQIRPSRLLAKTACKRLDLAWEHRLIGRDDQQGRIVYEGTEGFEIRADLRVNTGLLQKPERYRSVSAARSQ
jgi:hypothetical protein